MTLELLFAKASQGRTFLLMVLCGAALALGIHLAGLIHRCKPLPGMAADVLCAAGLALALCRVLLTSGEGLRLYALLGLCIGGVIYSAGIAPAVGWIARQAVRWGIRLKPGKKTAKISLPQQQECPPPMQNF